MSTEGSGDGGPTGVGGPKCTMSTIVPTEIGVQLHILVRAGFYALEVDI